MQLEETSRTVYNFIADFSSDVQSDSGLDKWLDIIISLLLGTMITPYLRWNLIQQTKKLK